MKKDKSLLIDSFIALGLLIASGVGVFYRTIHFDRVVENVYGDRVLLFGRGIYAYESAFQGPIFIGTDLVIFVLVFVCFGLRWGMHHPLLKPLVHIGFLTVFLYYSASLAFGTMMNRLFIVYIATFGLVFFRLVYMLLQYDYKPLQAMIRFQKMPKGLLVFLVIMGLSVSVWFIEIITVIIDNRPSELIGIKTTEPTYIFDLALIAPACFIAVYTLKQKRAFGIVLSAMMLTLLSAIGLIVIAQTLTQSYFGVEVGLAELIVFVFSFAFLSGFAIFYLLQILRKVYNTDSG